MRTSLRLIPVGALLLVGAACVGDDVYRVGDTGPGGGIVYYVSSEPFPCGENLESFCSHLEVAPPAGDAVRVWAEEPYVNEDNPGAGRYGIGTGWANTADIIAQGNTDPATSAAAYAAAYEHGGKDDWYLPSRDELHELYEQREAAAVTMGTNYWTSSDYDLNTVWNQSFLEGPQHRRLKYDLVNVRPVRAF